MNNAKHKNSSNKNIGGLFKIKHRAHLVFMDIEGPPQKNLSQCYQSGPLSFEYFLDGLKIVSNSGFGVNISKKG